MISGRAFPPLFFGPLTGILELNFVTGKFGTSSRATRKGLFIFLFFIFYFILFFFSLSLIPYTHFNGAPKWLILFVGLESFLHFYNF